MDSRDDRESLSQSTAPSVLAVRTESLLSFDHLSVLMASISVVVRRHSRRAGGIHTYETSDEIAHCWQLLTKEQQMSLDDQAAKTHEDLPVLLERLFKERRL